MGGKDGRPELNPENSGPVRLQYDLDTGRVIDHNSEPILEHEEFKEIPMRRLFGPLANRKVHNPRFGNIFTGVPESKTHHNKEVGKPRVSGDFFGKKATYGYCPVWGDVHGRWQICGREMCLKSNGCGVHGREGIAIYQLQAKGEPIPGRLMVDPKLIKQREEEEAEIRRENEALDQASSNIESTIEAAKENDGVSPSELHERLMHDINHKLKIESETSKSRKAKAMASKKNYLQATISEQSEQGLRGNARPQGANGSKSSCNKAKKYGGGKKRRH